MSEELTARVTTLETTVYGDRTDPKAKPGMVAELMRTNEILTDVRDSMRKLNWIVIMAVASAAISMVLKTQ